MQAEGERGWDGRGRRSDGAGEEAAEFGAEKAVFGRGLSTRVFGRPASKSGCKTACGGGCGCRMTARMGCSVSSPPNVCSDTINAGRCLGLAPGAERFAT